MKRATHVPSTLRVGVDTGGTFTDFVFSAEGQVQVFKLPSTPGDPSQAIIAGLKRIAETLGVQVDKLEVLHGTTVGTNALIERRGARTALITTKGFEDVIAIGRQARPELYNLNASRPGIVVGDELRFGVNERIGASGEVLLKLNESELPRLIKSLRKARVDSIAICLLFSFLHPEHEERIAEALNSLNVPLSVSHRILPEYREYERVSTTTINAYLQPLMGAYLKILEATAPRLKVMQSSGGVISAPAAADEPVRTILSGPAGGVVGARRLVAVAGYRDLITFDMGGTSTDVALCERAGVRMTNEATIAGMPVAVSLLDIHTVGAGGGSIARVDEGGSLRVGPESAGADPGPACYGRSRVPTVTDAHLVLGHFGKRGLLGGEFPLDHERAFSALKQLASEMSTAAGRQINVVQAADGVLSVVNTNMERALRHISVERGFDPWAFSLIPFGGAGGLHAVELARALEIPRVVSPPSGGALSAIGVLTADVVKDKSQTVMLLADSKSEAMLNSVFREMERRVRSALRNEGFAEDRQRHERFVAMRYLGQSFELEIKSVGNLVRAFHRAHKRAYGYVQEDNAVQIVSLRLRSSGLLKQRPPRRLKSSHRLRSKGFVLSYFGQRSYQSAVIDRAELTPGTRVKGPAIVTEYSATTLIPPRAEARVDSYGNLIVEVGAL